MLSVLMSRGFGWVQTAALVYIYEMRVAFTRDFARELFGPSPAPSDISSLRRALRRLRAQGLVASCGREQLLWIMPKGVPARLGWQARGPGLDMQYGFDPEQQRRNQSACICDSKGRIRR